MPGRRFSMQPVVGQYTSIRQWKALTSGTTQRQFSIAKALLSV
jgi:hypothetical protein